ncbi:MAG: ATP-binding protein [Pseudonocardiales bacterium]|nr:ATP-binding protein [Pseudonocardiales bacterium]
MPRLLLINGLPGSGKSTLAERYIGERPLALSLDVDVVRGLLGRWLDRPTEAGQLARQLALSMGRVALREGRDVVVPQFLARPQFIQDLEMLAQRSAAEFVEVVLVEDLAVAMGRLAQRAAQPETAVQRDAHVLLDRDGGVAALPRLHRLLHDLLATRSRARWVTPVPGNPDETYRRLLSVL